jgi:phosphatidylglycerophosphate synthase
MIALGWIMLKFDQIDLIFPTILATIFNIWSGYEYFMMGYRQLPGKSRS